MFHKHLATLYSERNTLDQTQADTIISHTALPSLSSPQRDSLKKPIEPEEVLQAIKSHKRPRPDGFSATYYKKNLQTF